jgi:hypothetical protein
MMSHSLNPTVEHQKAPNNRVNLCCRGEANRDSLALFDFDVMVLPDPLAERCVCQSVPLVLEL